MIVKINGKATYSSTQTLAQGSMLQHGIGTHSWTSQSTDCHNRCRTVEVSMTAFCGVCWEFWMLQYRRRQAFFVIHQINRAKFANKPSFTKIVYNNIIAPPLMIVTVIHQNYSTRQTVVWCSIPVLIQYKSDDSIRNPAGDVVTTQTFFH